MACDGVNASHDLAREIFRFCGERLAPSGLFMAWIAFVGELPPTSTNKIQKYRFWVPTEIRSHSRE